MGRRSRKKPKRLRLKLKLIRKQLGFSQDEIIAAMGLTGELIREEISAFETGRREPPLEVLLQYGRLAGVIVDTLIDDGLDLPAKLPASPKSEGVPRRPPKS
jgi:transcriptional regulator with XRE-family HTH domain